MRKNTQEVRMELDRRRDQYQERKNRRRKQLIAVSGGLCCVALAAVLLFPVQTSRRTLEGDSMPGATYSFAGDIGKSGEEFYAGTSTVQPTQNQPAEETVWDLQEAVQESVHYQQGQYEYYLLNIDTGIRALRIVENKTETLLTDPAKIRAFLNLLNDTIEEDGSSGRNSVRTRGVQNYLAKLPQDAVIEMGPESVLSPENAAARMAVSVLFGDEEYPLYWTADEARKQTLREQLQK